MTIKYLKPEFIIFILLYYTYASYHACRVSFDNSKDDIQQEWLLSKQLLGAMDSIFLFMYSFGQFIAGVFGDRFLANNVHGYGLLFTCIFVLLFGISVPYLKFTNNDTGWFILLWIFNGFTQSMGWPTSIKILYNYFKYSSHYGLIFGFWCSCQPVGDLLGTLYHYIIIHYYKNDSSLQWVFILPSIQAFIAFIIAIFIIKPSPTNESMINININNPESKAINDGNNDDIKQDIPPKKRKKSKRNKNNNNKRRVKSENFEYEPEIEYQYGMESDSDESLPENQHDLRLSFGKLITLPILLQFSFIFGCIKSIHYSILFWLPYFLDKIKNETYDKINVISITYSIGGIFGSIICGIMTDNTNKFLYKVNIIFYSTILSIIPIFLLRVNYNESIINYIFSFIVGLLLGGPESLIPSLFACIIGQKLNSKGKPASISSITGIINGFGSFATSIIVLISTFISYDIFFIILAILGLLASILFIPIIIDQKNRIYKQEYRQNLNNYYSLQIETP